MSSIFFVLQGKSRRAFPTRDAALASLGDVTKVMDVDDTQSLVLLSSGELVPIFCVPFECASPEVPSPVHRPRCPSSMESTGGALEDEDATSPALRSLLASSPSPLPLPAAAGATSYVATNGFSTPERKRGQECPWAPQRKRLSPKRDSLFRAGDMDTNAACLEEHVPVVHRVRGPLFVTEESKDGMGN
jgi:hypothetical protein